MNPKHLPVEPAMPDQNVFVDDPEFNKLVQFIKQESKSLVVRKGVREPRATHIADEIGSVVIGKAWDNWSWLKDCPWQEAWIRKVVYYEWCNYWRRNGRDPTKQLPNGIGITPPPQAKLPSPELLQALEECKDELPEPWRKVLNMKFDCDCTLQQIADELGMTLNSLAALYYKILKALLKCLQSKNKDSIND